MIICYPKSDSNRRPNFKLNFMKRAIQLIGILIIIIIASCANSNTSTSISNDTITVKELADESDDSTENSISTPELSQSNPCLDIAMEILTTSPAYLKKTKGLYEAVVKNGGTSFGITVEGSPNPQKDNALDYSENYDFNLHETYPDRSPVIARFTFNTSEKKLYEYDVAENKLVPIKFDSKLLMKFDEICE